MVPHPRYEIVGAIASGDFATVYRGRDRELAREVAIKQIHQHFLQDPKRLESYWKEAQLLASLAHPHVMTIYDLVRDRGWLILELMQGTVQQYSGGQPLDVDVLRTALTGTLEALAFLHKGGVTHGDVKPSNLLIDRLNRIKLGDFGLARRASNEQGSLLKGTTKYMAPEMLSNQFGRVGPVSDLYSLGFSAYELACGQQFDDLFPGLAAFGTDRQIAWMMWHAAPDRLAPPIDRVLPGFPADMAKVITRLIAKPQSQRYRNAEEALRDLNSLTNRSVPVDTTSADALVAQQAAKRKRLLAFGAFGVSAALSLAVLFWPKSAPPPIVTPPPAPAIQGIVRQVTPSRQILIVEIDEAGVRKEIEVRLGEQHRVFLNDKASLLRDLHEQDRVVISTIKDAEGHDVKEVQAARAQADQGKIALIQADEGTVTITTGDLQASKPLVLAVPVTTQIKINQRPGPSGQPYTLADLKVGDDVVVEHSPNETGRYATVLEITRPMLAKGQLVKVDAAAQKIQWQPMSGSAVELPVASNCELSLNGRRLLNQAPLTLKDLRPGDEISLAFDTQVTRLDAKRSFQERGVIRNVAYDVRSMEVAIDGRPDPKTFIVPADCQITTPSGKDFAGLRRGDVVQVTHASPDGNNIEISSLVATRPSDSGKWAILIDQQKYDDEQLSGQGTAGSEVAALQDVLQTSYAVPPTQVIALKDESRIRLAKAIPDALAQAAKAKQLIVAYTGRGVIDDQGHTYLAPKEFALDRVSATGVPLKWLIEQLEASTAGEKLLLFDAGFRLASKTAGTNASSAEMIETIRGTKSSPGLRTVTVIASGKKGVLDDLRSGAVPSAFQAALAKGFAGEADKDRNLSIDATELMGYFPSAGTLTPELFLPNNTPPRLTEEARQAIRVLASTLNQTKIDTSLARRNYEEALALAPKQPEAEALYVLVLLKQRQFPESQRRAEELKVKHPQCLAVYEANAWNRFSKNDFIGGITELTSMVTKLQMTKEPTPAQQESALRALKMAGQLREFAGRAVDERAPKPEALQALDAAALKLGPAWKEAYDDGRHASDLVLDDFDAKIAALEARLTGDDSEDDRQALLRQKFERKQLRHYLAFPFDEVGQSIVTGMDD